MSTENQIKLMRDAETLPTEDVLKQTLGKNLYNVYHELLTIITGEFDLKYEWRYYRDGKSWLFKAIYKKKTIFWLSIWQKFIKTSFYFTAKTRSGIFDLPISREIKENFKKAGISGKLVALVLNIHSKEQLKEFREIVKYKKDLK